MPSWMKTKLSSDAYAQLVYLFLLSFAMVKNVIRELKSYLLHFFRIFLHRFLSFRKLWWHLKKWITWTDTESIGMSLALKMIENLNWYAVNFMTKWPSYLSAKITSLSRRLQNEHFLVSRVRSPFASTRSVARACARIIQIVANGSVRVFASGIFSTYSNEYYECGRR